MASRTQSYLRYAFVFILHVKHKAFNNFRAGEANDQFCGTAFDRCGPDAAKLGTGCRRYEPVIEESHYAIRSYRSSRRETYQLH